MQIDSNYTPKYVDLDDIPLVGVDEYTSAEKRKTLLHAEARFEAEVNDGATIPPENVTNLHKVAVINLATYLLTHAAEDPADVRLGDLNDGGNQRRDYSERFLTEYKEIVMAIRSSKAKSGGIDNYSYTTGT